MMPSENDALRLRVRALALHYSPEVRDLPAAVQLGRDAARQAEAQLLDVQARRPRLDLGLGRRRRDLDQELLVCGPTNRTAVRRTASKANGAAATLRLPTREKQNHSPSPRLLAILTCH